ncbi:retinol dehydrogenase 7 [Dermatophagoides farinae]|uniref:retinol dehydrogenase 7 n=1 Tax=Dermatophagoides farinae TaxID=6954 RepID=UPI003F60701F
MKRNESSNIPSLSSANHLQQQQQPYLYIRHYIFISLLTILFLLCQIHSFHAIIQWLQDTLFNLFIIYVAWNVAYFIHDWLEYSTNILPKNHRLSDMDKRAILITGCDSGFGLYLAQNLHQQGYHIIAGCLSIQSIGAKKLCEKNYEKIFIIEMDVTNEQSVNNAREQIQMYLQSKPEISLWSIVNNAGIMSLCEIEFGNMSTFTKQMDVNGMGVVLVTKTFLPLLRHNHFGRARIVNIASLAGRFTMPGFVAYCMSKAIVIAFTDGLRRELAKWNIEVVSIEPHLYRTNLVNQQRLIAEFEQQWNQIEESIRKDYGRSYHEGFVRTMTQAMDSARSEIEQVVRTMERAVTTTQVEYSYTVARYSERIRIWFWQTIAPICVIDFFMRKFLTDCNGQPKMLKEKMINPRNVVDYHKSK